MSSRSQESITNCEKKTEKFILSISNFYDEFLKKVLWLEFSFVVSLQKWLASCL